MELKKIGEKDDRILLKSDTGEQGWFLFLDMLSYGGREYALLADETEEPIVMEFTEAEGRQPERFTEISDDAVFDAVASLFEAQDEE